MSNTEELKQKEKINDLIFPIILVFISAALGAWGGKLLTLSTINEKLTNLESQVLNISPKIMVIDPNKFLQVDSSDKIAMKSLSEEIKANAIEYAKNGGVTLWGHSVINAPEESYFIKENK
jgi:hypothetical protein